MRQWMIDAFASAPFKGNPACVLATLDAWPDAAWMQSLAAENNQAETAFLLRTGEPGRFGLRWFTPAMEVPLCGHATLASGHVLFAEMGVAAARPSPSTPRPGPLTVARAGDGYQMDFPADPPRRIEPRRGARRGPGLEPREVWAGAYLVAVMDDEAAVRALTPDIAALKPISSRRRPRGRGNVGGDGPRRRRRSL